MKIRFDLQTLANGVLTFCLASMVTEWGWPACVILALMVMGMTPRGDNR